MTPIIETEFTSLPITRRGWIAIWIASLILGSGFTFLTRDVCWSGTGYSSCATQNSAVNK